MPRGSASPYQPAHESEARRESAARDVARVASRQAEVEWLDKADYVAAKAAQRERESAAEAAEREHEAAARSRAQAERAKDAAANLARLQLMAEQNSPEARRAALERRCGLARLAVDRSC